MTSKGHRLEAERGPSPRRILLVDDHAESRGAIAIYLRFSGFEVVEAGDGRSALAAIEAGPKFLALLTDLSLPDVDGREVARRLHERWPDSYVGMVTGWSLDPEEYQPWGIDGVFPKPANLSEIRQLLDGLAPR